MESNGQNVKKRRRRRRRRPAPSSSSSASPPLPSLSSSPVSCSLLYGGTKEVGGPTIRKREPTSPPSHPASPPYSPSTSSPPSSSSPPASYCFLRKPWSERNDLSIGSFLSQKNSSSPLQWPPRPRRSATVPPPSSTVSSLLTLPSDILSVILGNLACEDWGNLRLSCKLLARDILRHAPSPTSLAQLPKSFLYKLFSNLPLVDLKNLRMAFALQKFNLNIAVEMFLYVFEESTQETRGRYWQKDRSYGNLLEASVRDDAKDDAEQGVWDNSSSPVREKVEEEMGTKVIEEALVRNLTAKTTIDIMRGVVAAKGQGKPYVIVFIGDSEVGKSTSLAKVAYWLLQHKISVMMVACDTSESGAAEEQQLRTHACRLQVPLFEKACVNNPFKIAMEAIDQARCNKVEVVLLDTAGRKPDNYPKMRALYKLILLNSPDLTLFVGEASLVANGAVNQFLEFNQKLADQSSLTNPRLIDGVILTKLDAIDDKVGALLSMASINAPVVFASCGKSYTDLKEINVNSIKSFLKSDTLP